MWALTIHKTILDKCDFCRKKAYNPSNISLPRRSAHISYTPCGHSTSVSHIRQFKHNTERIFCQLLLSKNKKKVPYNLILYNRIIPSLSYHYAILETSFCSFISSINASVFTKFLLNGKSPPIQYSLPPENSI